MRVNTRSLPRDEIRSILEQVIGWLESGEITEVLDADVYQKILTSEEGNEQITHGGRGFFAMQDIENNCKCGTVACIGGWMDVAARDRGHIIEDAIDYDESPYLSEKEREGLYNLFMAWTDGKEETRYRTRADAVKAARVWLDGTYEYNPWFPDQPDPHPDY